VNWSIHGVFKQISIDNRCFPAVAGMFFSFMGRGPERPGV